MSKTKEVGASALVQLDEILERVGESIIDALDSKETKICEAIGGFSDPVDEHETELHERMAKAAMAEYIRTVLPGAPIMHHDLEGYVNFENW